ncbi:APC family permease [Methylobacterium sp. BTF04]|uniref:APC family permease n=1 Tax=Methylobacterium sp. BTF04 TaxID=2708300 RepID=UPI0013D662BB|nr:APC family permease [Methylobacterium sp. BTF04]NEU14756.1 APC family permease [Methylobacterium sp. BTF04]
MSIGSTSSAKPPGGYAGPAAATDEGKLHRSINWTGAFWVASGVPALVLFSVGGIANNTGKLAFLIWTLSMIMGFIQSFTYAEIAGLFPNKSGGASIYGAAAWVRYAKLVAPLSVWCNWFAWSPVLSLGCSIAASYMINAVAPAPTATSPAVVQWLATDGASLQMAEPDKLAAAIAAVSPGIRTWSLFQTTFGSVSLSLNVAFFIGAALMLAVFAVQHRGILGTANVQKYIGLLVIIPMFIVGVVPLLIHGVNWENFSPMVPLAVPGAPAPGTWDIAGWTLVLGSMFIAAWSTYGFETAVCYTSEFRDPAKDTFKAIFYSGVLCLALFTLVPFTFQSMLGAEGMLEPSIVDGSGVAAALAHMVGGGPIIENFLVLLMILALVLCIMTAMAGSSRTLFQGSADGWLPRYLSHVNEHGAPTRAMWTDLIFNLAILAIACADATSFFFILAVSNCGYIIFNFLNLNSAWIHRIDSAHIPRPYRAPTFVLVLGGIFAFVNVVFMGAGAKVWNPIALWAGLITAALIIPVFCYRHYVQDGGKFPTQMFEDLHVGPEEAVSRRRAGILPYVTLVAGVAVLLLSNWFFQL